MSLERGDLKDHGCLALGRGEVIKTTDVYVFRRGDILKTTDGYVISDLG